jgi:RNA recognition motif-containing protein
LVTLHAGVNLSTLRYRLQVTNLNASVSESDLVDLFCAIGAVRDSRLQSTGEAIVTFVKRAAAMAAITKYNGRELDGQKISGMFSNHYLSYESSSESISNYGAAEKVTLSMEK